MEEGLLKPRLKGCMRRARGIRRENFLVTGMTCIRVSRESRMWPVDCRGASRRAEERAAWLC